MDCRYNTTLDFFCYIYVLPRLVEEHADEGGDRLLGRGKCGGEGAVARGVKCVYQLGMSAAETDYQHRWSLLRVLCFEADVRRERDTDRLYQ